MSSYNAPDTVLNDLQILSCLTLKLMPQGKSETGFSGGWRRTLRHRLLSLLVKMGLQEPDELSVCDHHLKWRYRSCWTQSLLEYWWKLKKTCDTAINELPSTLSGQSMTRWALCPSRVYQPQGILWQANTVPSTSICLHTCISN